MSVKFARCRSRDVSKVPITDGQMVYLTDVPGLFADMDGNRYQLVKSSASLPLYKQPLYKNLLSTGSYSRSQTSTSTNNGLTITYTYTCPNYNSQGVRYYNAIKQIDIQGTASADTSIWLTQYSGVIQPFSEKDTYTLSGCPEGGGLDKYYLELYSPSYYGESTASKLQDCGEGVTFTGAGNYTAPASIRIVVKAGQVMNHTFYPMIRYADDIDLTFDENRSIRGSTLESVISSIDSSLGNLGEFHYIAKGKLVHRIQSTLYASGSYFTINLSGSKGVMLDNAGTVNHFNVIVHSYNSSGGLYFYAQFLVTMYPSVSGSQSPKYCYRLASNYAGPTQANSVSAFVVDNGSPNNTISSITFSCSTIESTFSGQPVYLTIF